MAGFPPGWWREQHGQVVKADRHVGMIGPEALFRNSQRPAVKRLGLSQPVGGAEQHGQIVEAGRHVGMAGMFSTLRPFLGDLTKRRLNSRQNGSFDDSGIVVDEA